MSEFLGSLLVELLDVLLHVRDAQQRRRSRLKVTEAAELMRQHGQPRATVDMRCPERDGYGWRCLLKPGHAEQHKAAHGWPPVAGWDR